MCVGVFDWTTSPEPRFMGGCSTGCDSLKLLGWMPFSDATLSCIPYHAMPMPHGWVAFLVPAWTGEGDRHQPFEMGLLEVGGVPVFSG